MRPIRVLLVEDNPGDADLARETLQGSRIFIDFSVATDGVLALETLKSAAPPDLVLLDLNLPRKNGREVLAEMRADPRLRHVPVVVLTSSEADTDIIQSYELGANCYVTKPVDLRAFQTIVGRTGDFWFTIVRLPNG